MALTIDVASAKTAAVAAQASAFVSNAFTTTATNELMVVLVSCCDNATDGNTLTTVVTGAGLTWTMRLRANNAHNQVSEIWTAPAASILTSQTVSVQESGTVSTQVLSWAVEVLSFKGADTVNPIGATGTAINPNGTTANPSVTLSTTTGSYAVAAGACYYANATIVAGTGQTLLAVEQDSTNAEAEWTQRSTSTTSTSQTMNNTGLAANGWVFAAAEILASGAAFVPVPPPRIVRQAVQRAATR